jgi:hypothetical protein
MSNSGEAIAVMANVVKKEDIQNLINTAVNTFERGHFSNDADNPDIGTVGAPSVSPSALSVAS